MRKITGKDIAAALHTSSPIIVTFVVLGTGYGILMQTHGYGPLWSLLSGIIIFSGTAQFVSVTMLSSGSVLMAGLTALMISARHIFFSISMIGRYSGEGRRKAYLYYALCDETYAMLSKDDGPEGVNVSNYRLLVTLFDQCAWLTGSFLGGWIGTMLTFDSTGIDFEMPSAGSAGGRGDSGMPHHFRTRHIPHPRDDHNYRSADRCARQDRAGGR